ncbi:MAG: helix-turn-helix domain-containing protein [Beijerinckiaceae bacterium]
MTSLSSIDLDISAKLKDESFRRSFFLAESSAKIAQQLVALRKRRSLTQTQLAERAGTKQPAVSRAERADYQNWSFSTLRSLADALDARLRVVIEASEDVLWEYRAEEDAQNGKARQSLTNQLPADPIISGQEDGPSAAKFRETKQSAYLAIEEHKSRSKRLDDGVEGNRV